MGGNLLYSKFTNLNVNLNSKNTFTKISRIMLDQLSEYWGPDKVGTYN